MRPGTYTRSEVIVELKNRLNELTKQILEDSLIHHIRGVEENLAVYKIYKEVIAIAEGAA